MTSFSQEVKNWLEDLVTKKEHQYLLKVEREVELEGDSGEPHRMDFTIAKQGLVSDEGTIRWDWQDKILVEVKAFGERGSRQVTTYGNALRLAYAELADFPEKLPKFVVIPQRMVRRPSAFNFDKYLASIGAILVDFSNGSERSYLEEVVDRLT